MRIVKLLNSLPEAAVGSQKVAEFKRKYDEWFGGCKDEDADFI